MAEKFFFDFFQIPATGVQEPDLVSARTDVNTTIRRPIDMKISNFGALGVGSRLSSDYTRINTMTFKFKGESEDWSKITEDTGVGQNVRLFGVTTNRNPYVVGSSVKFVRDDQFIRMTMSRNTGTATAATEVDPPKFDVMDTKERTAVGINASTNATLKNWPSEGWRSFGGKYDFLPYYGGNLK
jgi:hypothetical protein